MIWIELRKAIQSRLPLWTGAASFFMPFGMAFLIFVARNPEISARLGLISAKANLLAYAATDWPAYLRLQSQVIAAGGFFFSVLAIAWVFGREFADGTLKDMLAVPVSRSRIVLAKFGVAVVWSAVTTVVVLVAGLVVGALLRLPGGSAVSIFEGVLAVGIAAGLAIVTVLPFALFASIGRGYLLPLGMAVLSVMAANLVALLGWGEYFPWAVPLLFAMGKEALPPMSFAIVLLTGVLGVVATDLWWTYADQNR
ncbi:MAG TPA: ABC transporter permease [Anaerolineales bacterium]|nr:ABC transporter permease [Anaerolineales bacterium]